MNKYMTATEEKELKLCCLDTDGYYNDLIVTVNNDGNGPVVVLQWDNQKIELDAKYHIPLLAEFVRKKL